MNFASVNGEIHVIDVCLRDGLQNLTQFVPTEIKKNILDLLAGAGLTDMEITSFVSPKAVPQMSDSGELVKYAQKTYPKLRASALIPNLRGAELAADYGVSEVTYVVSAGESHNRANVNRTVEESMSMLAEIRKRFPSFRIRLSLATSFVCPFEGRVPQERVMELAGRAINMGADTITFCDTVGAADPLHVASVAREAKRLWPTFPIGMHLHNTYGLGLANTLAAAREGVDTFETSTGGLGGCPFAPGAAGNTPTEDMVYMFDSMRVRMNTKLSLGGLLRAVAYMETHVEGKFTGSVYAARKAADRRYTDEHLSATR
jgi:hydroxymethylglutaryl-CoA lyase